MRTSEHLKEAAFRWSLIAVGGFVGACLTGFSIVTHDLVDGLLLTTIWGGGVLLTLGGMLALAFACWRIMSRRRLTR